MNGQRLFSVITVALSLVGATAHAAKESLDHKPESTPKSMSLSYEKLNAQTPGTEGYWKEFVVLQKQHYEASSWDRFFGFSAFYRNYLVQEQPTSTFIPDLFILEILGLIKHCQFEPAEKVIGFSREAATRAYGKANQDLPKFIARLDMLANYMKLQGHLPNAVETDAIARKIQPFSKTLEWKIPAQIRSATVQLAIISPAAIRVYVEDRCEKN